MELFGINVYFFICLMYDQLCGFRESLFYFILSVYKM